MANNWWEIKILCDLQLEDLVFWRLEAFGCEGTASEHKSSSLIITAYLPQEGAQLLDLSALSLWLRQDALVLELPVPTVQWALIDDQDWSSAWKEHWKPEEIGSRFLIYPAWLTPPENGDRVILRVDPGLAFGTGNHATTQLCLESLEMRVGLKEEEVIIADIGCGSGILGIAAILSGATKVYAVDTSTQAVKATILNRELNQIDPEQLIVQKGSIELIPDLAGGLVDGILCNILAEVIVDLVPAMTEITKPKGWAILSGILLDEAKPIADTLEEHGWVVATLWKRGEWCCFNVRKS